MNRDFLSILSSGLLNAALKREIRNSKSSSIENLEASSSTKYYPSENRFDIFRSMKLFKLWASYINYVINL